MPFMSSASVAGFLALVALVLCANGQGAQQQYVAGMLPNIPSGYVLASLADLSSAEFLNQYNTVGINYIQNFGGGAICCVVSVAEGFLSIGPSDSYSNFVEPYLNGVDTCTSSTQPNGTTFGVPSFSPGPYSGMWISTLSPKEQAGFRVTGVVPTIGTDACSTPGTAIYKSVPKYVIRPTGPNYPAPRTSEYVVASLTEVQSLDFQTFYNNAGGILLTGSNQTNYCCMIRVADGGWLYYGTPTSNSPLSLFTEDTYAWACNVQSNNQIHTLGTSFGGPLSGDTFVTLNTTTQQQFGSFLNNSQGWDGCNSALPDSLTVFKRVQPPKYIVRPTGPNYPSPPTSEYQEISLAQLQSVDFQNEYNTNGGILLNGVNTTNYCCMIRVAGGGWLNYSVTPSGIGYSPLTLYSGGGWSCGIATNNQIHSLGTYFGGPDDDQIFQTLNPSITQDIGVFTNNTSANWDQCSLYPDSLTMYIRQ